MYFRDGTEQGCWSCCGHVVDREFWFHKVAVALIGDSMKIQVCYYHCDVCGREGRGGTRGGTGEYISCCAPGA